MCHAFVAICNVCISKTIKNNYIIIAIEYLKLLSYEKMIKINVENAKKKHPNNSPN